GWNYYKFHVSDAVANRWADFPNVGVSNNEVYVTVNLFTNSNYFDKVLLYQINKQNGYNNQSLQFTTWTDITDNQGDPPFTLVPVSYGHQGNYGPGIVLCATEDPGSSNKVQIFDLTADLGGGAQLNGYSASIPSFQIGGNAVQPDDGDEMDIGDCRMKNAFFLNNTVHCVFTSNYQSGWNGINYSRVELSSMTATNKKFGAVGRDMGYPALASFSNNAGDKTVVIGYEESSTTINPCFKAVVCDDAMTFGTAVLLKAGATFIDVDPGNFERWGDYLGIHRRFTTSSPTVWVFGIYAKNSSNGGIYGNNAVELINTSETALGSSTKPSADITVYPNPGELYFTVMLQVAKAAETRFELYDASGRLVKHLTTKHLTPGKFQFGFNSDALSAGVYFLRVQTAEKTIANEKIVIQ
ncbi:MAG TPA: T9SS type A sorting domain-containing protein, partial [Chitinophagales bacterium]|nr:T9SS type A sorting domain-containing protein [Chitinophagales bacterium]